MKKQLLLFIASFVSFLNAMASSNAGINASKDVQIQQTLLERRVRNH